MKRYLSVLLVFILAVSMVIAGAGCGSGTTQRTVEVPAGWKLFDSDEFELYLPEQWEGGAEEKLQDVIEILKEEGQTELASQVEAGIGYIIFWGYDSETISSGALTNINIASQSASSVSLNQYMELGYDQMAEQYEQMGYSFSILEQNVVSLGSYKEVGRTLVSEEVMGFEVRLVQYVVKSGSVFWIITFTTSPEEFDRYIQIFDKAVETFIVK
jgi:hypothetical protein